MYQSLGVLCCCLIPALAVIAYVLLSNSIRYTIGMVFSPPNENSFTNDSASGFDEEYPDSEVIKDRVKKEKGR
jgi:hypothetical protein